MKRIRKGDEIIVIAGKAENKGRRGSVLKVAGDYIIVEGINIIFKHMKPNRQLQIEGSIVKKEAPIHISNVLLYNPSTGKGDRVGFKMVEGKKVRVYKSTGAQVD